MANVKRLRASNGAMASARFQQMAELRYLPSRKNIPPAMTSSFALRKDFASFSDSSTRIFSAR